MTSRTYNIVLLPGDGIGPDVTHQSRRVLDTLHTSGLISLEITEIPCAGSYYIEHGREWPEGSFEQCRAADAIQLGAIGHLDANGKPVRRADGELAGYEQVIGLRTKLELFANMRPIRLFPGVRHSISGSFKEVWRPQDVDLVVFRENTEGAYTPGEFRLERGTDTEFVISPTVITARGAARVAKEAFHLASRRNGAPCDGKRRVTCVDKSNVVRAHRFFREVFRSVAKDFPTIEIDFAYVDAFAHALITKPERYDVVVAPNLPGDIITDLGSALQGGMGMAASGNLGEYHAMFEPIHGSAPDIAGKGIANPVAAIMSTGMMLRWLGERNEDSNALKAAKAVDMAITDILQDTENHPADLGGTSTTAHTGDSLLVALHKHLESK